MKQKCDCCEEDDIILLEIEGEKICRFCLKTAVRWAEIDKKKTHEIVDLFVEGIKKRKNK